MNIQIKRFVDEVKDEILCYEELGQEFADKWEKDFYKWFDKNKNKDRAIKEEKGKVYINVKDESEIFEIADSYFDAVSENAEKEYWENF